jgi:hypothetical protein
MWWFIGGGILYLVLLFTLGFMTLRKRTRVDVLLRDLPSAALAHRRIHAAVAGGVRLI